MKQELDLEFLVKSIRKVAILLKISYECLHYIIIDKFISFSFA